MDPQDPPTAPDATRPESAERVTVAHLAHPLPDGITDTFTFRCPYGCTVNVTGGQEQPHACDGVSVILDAWRALPDDVTFGQAAERFAEALKPLIREQCYQDWLAGVRDGRSGKLCYGVPEDVAAIAEEEDVD